MKEEVNKIDVKNINLIEVSAFVHATEDLEKVLKCIKSVVPFDFKYQASTARGYYGNPITIINVKIKSGEGRG